MSENGARHVSDQAAACAATIDAAVRAVDDPELPHVTIGDLGIVRSVAVVDDGGPVRTVRVVLTPTFTGCPATAQIRADVATVIVAAGYRAEIDVQLAPAWSSDWITPAGRAKLAAAGIAPPPACAGAELSVLLDAPVACPRCGSYRTRRLADFGSTACKAPHVCQACREPFEGFKPL